MQDLVPFGARGWEKGETNGESTAREGGRRGAVDMMEMYMRNRVCCVRAGRMECDLYVLVAPQCFAPRTGQDRTRTLGAFGHCELQAFAAVDFVHGVLEKT